MKASNWPLTIRDRQNLLCDTDDEAWVRHLFHFDGRGMSVSRWVSSEIYCSFVCCYNRSIMRRICRHQCAVLMSSLEPNVVHCLSSCVFCLVTCISPSASIICHMTATLSFFCVVMPGGYLLASITSNCLLSLCCIGRVITSGILAGDKSLKGLAYFAFRPLRYLHTAPVAF